MCKASARPGRRILHLERWGWPPGGGGPVGFVELGGSEPGPFPGTGRTGTGLGPRCRWWGGPCGGRPDRAAKSVLFQGLQIDREEPADPPGAGPRAVIPGARRPRNDAARYPARGGAAGGKCDAESGPARPEKPGGRQISGTVDWQPMTYTISDSGSHTLAWRYFKDGAVSGGEDCGWVDTLEWDGGGQPATTPGNTGQLYAKVNGVKVDYPGSVDDVTWTPWHIDLASLGVDVQNVTTLAIGIDGDDASGTLYFDNFRLEPAK